jgi:hypothetical protein
MRAMRRDVRRFMVVVGWLGGWVVGWLEIGDWRLEVRKFEI